MTRSLSVFLILDVDRFPGFIGAGHGISSKLDFGDEEASIVTNSSNEDDDVEVKHTIVVSTRLKNNNRRGLHTNEEPSTFIHTMSDRNSKKDSDEVPIIKAYKSVETTQIRTPDTRYKTTIYPEFVSINRNPRDEYDLYMGGNPTQFKPSSFYNNINWWNQDNGNNGFIRRNIPDYSKMNRRTNDDVVREFYCRKCRELKGCYPRNSWLIESTTPRIKIDGKIAKLN